MPIRQPIISVLAHVDHGKTTMLDTVRHSRVTMGEAGGITQHIGASEVPKDILVKSCGTLLSKFGIKVKIPGLLFVDTPGHAAFSLLRKRGGMLEYISILIIDINEGIKPQTKESIDILKQYKTPFVIAANKIDNIP
ncbi:MAG: GTP-binding protein, partial [archaeon]|nr:GTP-binding protein [archaeon]